MRVLVLSRLDYCNAVLAGLPATTLAQRVLHAAARLVLNLRPRDHVTPALRELHWLPVSRRIEFKLCLLVHKIQLGRSPTYLSDLLTLAADEPGRPVSKPRRLHCVMYKSHFLLLLPERAWNRLPMELRPLRSTPLFNRKLKTFLFTAELQN